MMTDAERRLWSILRGRRLQGYKFRRQRPVGPFIADFACIELQLIVEADGGQHNESETDARRTAWLEKRGWRVIRFWNNDILTNTEGVAETVLLALKDISAGVPSPSRASRGPLPLPQAGEGRGASWGKKPLSRKRERGL